MLGWINISICSFICDTFGVDKWEEVVATAGVNPNWASSCPYSDKITYDLVVTAAGLLGVSVSDALEAYGLYFVQHVEDQGYNRLLRVLGSNLAEFLQNLNDLHLHLQYCWPDMLAPAFRCDEVTPESLLLHYYSNRPGLWPIVVGVLKGLSKDYFKLDLQVELLHSREKGDADHEVLRLTYPYQQSLATWGQGSPAAQQSFFAMPAPLFHDLHPFHLIMDTQLRLLQWGAAVGRVVPELEAGKFLGDCFRVRSGSPKCKVPSFIHLDYASVIINTHSSFVLQGRTTGVTLKGQMLQTSVALPGSPPGTPPTEVLVYLCSPWMRSLADMQASGVFLSDIPRYDLSSDYILLAEQRQTEADLKDKFERLTLELQAANEKLARTTAWLEEEKARAEALLHRMSGLIACFPAGPGEAAALKAAAAAAAAAKAGGGAAAGASSTHHHQHSTHHHQQQHHQPQQQAAVGGVSTATTGGGLEGMLAAQSALMGSSSTTGTLSSHDRQSSALDRIEAVRRELARHNISSGESVQIQTLELLGEGTYGKVYKGLWKGSVVAVKTIVLPAAMSGQEKREKMAIMEAAISSALSHPNIMQTYTYDIKPIRDTSRPNAPQKLLLLGSTGGSLAGGGGGGAGGGAGGGTTATSGDSGEQQAANIHSYEVRLVCEYCDKGSLREALDLGAFRLPDSSTNYGAVLDTAVEIATAVAHLHHRNVLHSDLKARNIMLKSTGSSGRGVTSKVADFGLAVKMDHMETHLSNAFQGTMTHMAPEILIKGHISKAGDVYAFGMVLWELYTAKRVFKGIPRALLGHQITQLNRRPEFPANAPQDYVRLTQSCWDPAPSKRPTLETVLEELQAMRAALRCPTEPLSPYDIESLITARMAGSTSRAPHKQQQHGGATGTRRHAPPQKMPSAGSQLMRRGTGAAGQQHAAASPPMGGGLTPSRRSISTPVSISTNSSPQQRGLGGAASSSSAALAAAAAAAGTSSAAAGGGLLGGGGTESGSAAAGGGSASFATAGSPGGGSTLGAAMAMHHVRAAAAAAALAASSSSGGIGSISASGMGGPAGFGIPGASPYFQGHTASLAPPDEDDVYYGSDGGGSNGSSARSIYLEHSASTGDFDDPGGDGGGGGEDAARWAAAGEGDDPALVLQEISFTTSQDGGGGAAAGGGSSSRMQQQLAAARLAGCPFAAAAAAAGGQGASANVPDTRVQPEQQQHQHQQQQPPPG